MVASPTDAEEVIASSSDKNVEDTEKLRCVCSKPSESQMIACDNLECKVEWFHFKCVNIRKAPRGEWICIQWLVGLPLFETQTNAHYTIIRTIQGL